MRKMRNIWLTVWVSVCCAVLPAGCHKDDGPSLGERNVSVLMSVASRAGEETPTGAEAAINTLRVYAFVGGESAGHYYTDNPVLSPNSFLMDLKMFSTTTQTVDFYVVANEGAMDGLQVTRPFSFSENTTKAELDAVRFSSLKGNSGLPMFCCHSMENLDVATNAQGGGVDMTGHEGHTLLAQKVELGLQRPMAKLGVYAAKLEGENAGLKVTAVRMLAQGMLTHNYLMPQQPETLQKLGSLAEGRPLKVAANGVTVDKVMPKGATDMERRNSDNYTNVLEAPFYPFENPYGSDDWKIPCITAGKGNILEIDYNFGGETRTGKVYLPEIKRNHCYNVLCLMNNDGVISVAYKVADWNDEGKWDFDFAYPTYKIPLDPLPGGVIAKNPTMYYLPDSEKGAFSVCFTITAPSNVEWTPILPGTNENEYEVRVYLPGADGQLVLQQEPYGRTTSDRPFVIKVVPVQADNVNRTVKFGIVYKPEWLGENADPQFLLVNQGKVWSDSSEDAIDIKQIDTPTN